jgi:hypothetical protein
MSADRNVINSLVSRIFTTIILVCPSLIIKLDMQCKDVHSCNLYHRLQLHIINYTGVYGLICPDISDEGTSKVFEVAIEYSDDRLKWYRRSHSQVNSTIPLSMSIQGFESSFDSIDGASIT